MRVLGDVPVLVDGGVRLRAHEPGDLERIVEQSVDPDSVRFTTVPRPYTIDDAQAYVESNHVAWLESSPTSRRCWAITVGSDFAGSIDYRPTGVGTAEIGYGLHPAFRGRRLMPGALNLVLNYAFNDDGVDLVHWRAIVGNWASFRCVWRCGFRLEGTVRGLLMQPDGAYNGWIGSLHRDDRREPCEPWRGPRL